ncbi:MAG TPA: HAMP domain-containing sensor histidine kinase [Bacillota bacterium]|nr:HAMP domain-containing sensor histidine kinase [Bacillota bacterium]HOB29288.1 HAMP domain-containing sensor histidine kinase [Bacillota bacterium]HPZ41993.1 HAMP domain-containing sensor histidine kinase [Bacillota bacterium]HQD52789.1 HAMP domain-containing sensor histidine kinase [Bacillota bacterium]
MIKIKLSRNPEVNRLLAVFAMLIAGLLIAALLLGLAGRYRLKQAVIQNHASIVGAITEKYPEAEPDIINRIMHPDKEAASRGLQILSKYGIDRGTLPLETPLLQNYFRYNLTGYLLLAVLAGCAFAAASLLFLRKQYGQIRELTRYAEKISAGDYSLEIRDNREGDLSILKNEIYKITTLLKEQAGALQRDKTLLADSLADISHQLKTPLTSLFILNDLLSENPAAEKRALFLERMRAQLRRIEWLTSSLLKLSKLDAGAVPMKKEEIRVEALVKQALASLGIPLEIKALQVCLKGDAGTSFTGDFDWSCEALTNLLKNCIEHTPEKGRLQISFEQNPLYTVITIADSGIGIAPEDLPYIFNRFYKGKNAAADQVGIGLAMARAIVEKQGGEITVKSEQNRGAEFTIKFYRNVS